MIALICLLIPPLIWTFAREKVRHRQLESRKRVLSWLVCVVLLNAVMCVIIYLWSGRYGHLLYLRLNAVPKFACKYFGTAMVLALGEPLAEKYLPNVFRRIVSCMVQIPESVRRGARAIVFCLLLAAAFSMVNSIAQPLWPEWNNYNTVHGFYEEPKNTIETVFFGTSTVVNGIIPTELYRDYGICSYNFATEQQPMLASYYWLREAYRLHSKTLRTAVIDVSELRRTPDKAFYHKALDDMRFSTVKQNAVKDYSDLFDEKFIVNLTPLLSYHDRWKTGLSEKDFTRAEKKPDLSTRGYHFVTGKWIDGRNQAAMRLPAFVLDESAADATFVEESLDYLQRMISFCAEHKIRLVLAKLPVPDWTSSHHNAVQKIADKNHIDFLDFNFGSYFSDLNFNYSFDIVDGGHMNYYGASKVTNKIGAYLMNTCGNKDRRNDRRYDFMKAELEDYRRTIAKIRLNEITDPVKYLAYLRERGNYTVFISVMDEGSGSLRGEQRAYFASVGLRKLSSLSWRASYLAVIENGAVKTELTQAGPTDLAEGQGRPLDCRGSLSDGKKYALISGGFFLGNKSSVVIDGREYSPKGRGLNIVVYDNKRGEVIDRVSFDTFAASRRPTLDYAVRLKEIMESWKSEAELSGVDRELYLYNRRANRKRAEMLGR